MKNDLQTRNQPTEPNGQSRQNQENRQGGHSGHSGPASRYSDAALTPPVDVIEDAGGITLFADLPGVSRDKLHLQVEAETLTIEAEASLSVPEGLTSSHS
ncbi:MAG: heat-shock protein Hsp20, partial [Rhodoferax sp.]|nr:heat-shock protein Hsp20 [Rhodoferax sp.]